MPSVNGVVQPSWSRLKKMYSGLVFALVGFPDSSVYDDKYKVQNYAVLAVLSNITVSVFLFLCLSLFPSPRSSIVTGLSLLILG